MVTTSVLTKYSIQVVTVTRYSIVTVVHDGYPETVQPQEREGSRIHIAETQSDITHKAQALGPESPGFSFVSDTTTPCGTRIRSLKFLDPG